RSHAPAEACVTVEIPRLDHAAIGNGRVLALVSPTSAIEWLCLPRFDSPSCFARILDAERGGTFRFLSRSGEKAGHIEYLANTNGACTGFDDGENGWEVLDFAPRIPEGISVRVPIAIVRLLRPTRGHPAVRVDFDPRPDYGRATPIWRETAGGLEVHGGGGPLHLATNCPLLYIENRTEFIVHEPIFFVLSWGPPEHAPTLASVRHDLEA